MVVPVSADTPLSADDAAGDRARCTVPTARIILQSAERRWSAGTVFRTHEFTIVGGGPETACVACIQAKRVLCRR
ncbi:hypothetical protein O0S10_00170 [Methanocorpusculum sp. MG]|uniref:Uncharacterized protein n=1 Tax=Methanocorpusculum petauri TaxID=3002863 RepID=A0ABT4IET9_9EURY|nr:hypothetical protein [Methanocorpusculum petauri]MCZ0859638.1 hypothetical protein [Methanocorpusculum petauri]MDE2444340.1 hypothetical protein [Methanocorpusculum sp.]